MQYLTKILILSIVSLLTTQLISQCEIDVIVPDDFTVCGPTDINLNGEIDGDYLSFEWQGTNGFQSSTQLNPNVSITETATFTLTVLGLEGDELIENGDFEQGNTGFQTQYGFVEAGSPECFDEGFIDCEGTYGILDNPNDGHNAFSNCGDHTTGDGQMMVINGASGLEEIWCQEIEVQSGMSYAFSSWATSVHPLSPADLQFSIEGELVGSVFELSNSTCLWEQFAAIWTATSSATVEICITNQNTAPNGNDFALDDISFRELCEESNEFTVTFSEFELSQEDPEIINCNNPTTGLEINVDPPGTYTFEWSSDDGNIISSTDGETINVDQEGVYTVLVTNDLGCEETAQFFVEGDFLDPEPEIIGDDELNCDMPILELEVVFSGDDADITWFDQNGNILGDEAFLEVSLPGIYTATVINLDNGCSGAAEFEVGISSDSPDVSITQANEIDCNNPMTTLTAMSDFDILSYAWTLPDGALIEGDDLESITATEAGTYSVVIVADNGCISSGTYELNIDSAGETPEFNIPVIDCNNTDVTVSLINIDSFSNIFWLDENNNVINSDSLSTDAPGTYTFNAEDNSGCVVIQNVTVLHDIDPPIFELQNQVLTCETTSISLNPIFIDPYADAIWTTPNNETINQDSIIVDTPGTYSLSVIGLNGCSMSQDLSLMSQNDISDVNIMSSNLSCDTGTADLSVQVESVVDFDISWIFENQTISNDSNVVVMNSGIYQINITTITGCSFVDSIEVLDIINNAPLNLSFDSTVVDCAFLEVGALLDLTDIENFEWTLPDQSNSSENPLIINTSGTYIINATTTEGCTSEQVLEFDSSIEEVSFTASSASADCNNPTVEIDFQSQNDLDYFFDGLQIDPNDFELPDGTHLLIGEASTGCRDSFIIEIAIDTVLPEIMIDLRNITCIETEVNLSASLHPEILSYNWFNTMGQIIAQGPSAQIEDTGTYILIAVGANGCTQTTEFVVEEDIEPPILDLEVIPFDCLNESAGIIVNRDTMNTMLEWSLLNQTFESGDSLFTEQSGLYRLELTDNDNGCVSDSLINLQDNRVLLDSIQFVTQFNCGDPTANLNITEIFGGTPMFEIRVNDQIVSGVNNAIPDGISTIQIIDSAGCSLDTLVEVMLIEPLEVNGLQDLTIDWPSEVNLEILTNRLDEEIDRILWTPATEFNCQNCFVQNFTPQNALDVEVIVDDIFGCQEVINFRIDLNMMINIFFPNVFSPNRGNDNSIFYGFGQDNQINQVNSMHIYDRYGNLVFFNENFSLNLPDEGWDGQFKNRSAETGVYTYIAFVELSNGDIRRFVGDVTLID